MYVVNDWNRLKVDKSPFLIVLKLNKLGLIEFFPDLFAKIAMAICLAASTLQYQALDLSNEITCRS